MYKLWRLLRWPLGILLIYVVGILLYGTFTDWKPTGTQTLAPSAGQRAMEAGISDSILTFTTWNVGFGGLGAEEYFFYNNGDFFWTTPGEARAEKENVDRYVAGQELTLRSTQSDFFLLQEVDTASRRSYYRNQLAQARTVHPDYAAYFAANYRSKRVPLPLFQPWDHYGEVNSGLLTLSKYQPDNAERIQLPGEFPWPTRLFQLDRCLLRQVFATAFGRDLVVYNVHLSAYDKGGKIRAQQMSALREAVMADYAAGHYVVVGGDFNQLPPGFNWFSLNPTVERVQLPPTIGFDFLPPGWKWVFDPGTATVRDSGAPYDAHRSRRSVIDFFLLSPNLRIHRIRGIDQNFAFSDHHPVYVELELLR